MSVHLAPADARLAKAVARDGWLDDEETNLALGYGEGVDGAQRAYKGFRDAMQAQVLVGAFKGSTGPPVGFAVVSRPGPGLVQFHGLVAPAYRGTIWGARLIQAVEEATLGNGTYRLETEVLCRNERAIRLLKGLGFRPEGVHKARHEMDGHREHTLTMRKLKTERRHRDAV